MPATTRSARRLPVAAEAAELDILSCARRGRIDLAGSELRSAVTRDLELLGVLGDMEEQGLIAGELRFRLTAEGRDRLGELLARREALQPTAGVAASAVAS
jgi:hypothetical protein